MATTLHQIRRYLLPVEVFYFFYVYSSIFQMYFYQQYYFQSIVRSKLQAQINSTLLPDHKCLTQDYVVNLTSNASFVEMQKDINHLNMYSDVISIGTSFLSSILLGSLSDTFGRKPIAAFAVIGIIISTTLQTLMVYFKWNTYLFLVWLTIHGLSGGFPLVVGICFAIVADTTPRKWLGIRMSVLEASISMGKVVASLSTNNWIHHTRCSFIGPSLLNIGVSIIALIYLICMTESSPAAITSNYEKKVLGEINKSSRPAESNLSKLFNGLNIFFNPFYIGFSKWWRVWFATTIICLGCACSIGSTEIFNFFLHNKPLQWSYDKIGYYGAVCGVFMTAVLVIVLPLLVLMKVSYALIATIGSISGLVGNIITALVKNSVQMYIASIFLNAQQIVYPAMRVILEKCVSLNDRGAIFTVSASFQMLISVVASVVFNEVYQPQAYVNGHRISASTAFWIMTGIWATCIPLALCLQFIKSNQDESEEVEPLLSNRTTPSPEPHSIQ